MVSSFNASHFPAGQEVEPRDQPVPSDSQALDANGPLLVNDSGVDPILVTPTSTDYFIPSSALNNPELNPAPSSTLVSTPSLPNTSTSDRKYIIGGAVGGGVLVLILLTLLLFCCRKHSGKKDLERSEGQHSQFACCNHRTYNRNCGKSQMEQKTPIKSFVLKSGPVDPTPKERLQEHVVSLNRRDSAGSDTSADTLCLSDSEGSQRGTRRMQRRPPPLKLISLVTPVIKGPQDNPRRKANPPSPPGLHGVHTIVADPPQ